MAIFEIFRTISLLGSFEFWSFEFVSNFEIRYSNFAFGSMHFSNSSTSCVQRYLKKFLVPQRFPRLEHMLDACLGFFFL